MSSDHFYLQYYDHKSSKGPAQVFEPYAFRGVKNSVRSGVKIVFLFIWKQKLYSKDPLSMTVSFNLSVLDSSEIGMKMQNQEAYDMRMH